MSVLPMSRSAAIAPARSLHLTHVRGLAAPRQFLEAALDKQGIQFPPFQHAAWLRAEGWTDAILTVVRDGETRTLGVAATSIGRSRALPGHRIYRVERLASTGDA